MRGGVEKALMLLPTTDRRKSWASYGNASSCTAIETLISNVQLNEVGVKQLDSFFDLLKFWLGLQLQIA